MCTRRTLGALALCVALGLTSSARAEVTTFLNFTSFDTRLAELTSAAGVSAFSASERAMIQAGIQQKLEASYSAYSVTFTTASPSGVFETINFGATSSSSGSLGLADRIDYRNQFKNDVARVYTANFAFIIESGSSRATQIEQLTTALAGTAQHEQGHNMGLMHEDSYGDPAISYNGFAPVPTGGVQNTHIMATGGTGLGEAGRETDRTFSRLSMAKLDYADGLSSSPPPSTNEQAGAHGSIGTAQLITFIHLPSSGYDGRNVIGRINSNGESDFYSFDATAGSIFTADIMSGAIFGDDVDTVIRLFDPTGMNLLGQNDDTLFNSTTYGAGSGETLDSNLLNITLSATGRYYLEVLGFNGTSTGDYELLMLMDSFDAVPEPASAMIFGIGGTFFWVTRRRRRMALAS